MMGDVRFDCLIGKQIEHFQVTNNERLEIKMTDGTVRRFRVEGDCCSQSWIEHVEMPMRCDALLGSTLISVEDSGCVDYQRDGELKVYHIVFRTNLGDIVLEYRNSSNGYYGGYLELEREGT